MSALNSIASILNPDILSAPYREFSSAATNNNPMYEFFSGNGKMKQIHGDKVTIRYTTATKDPAPANTRGAVARTITTGTGLSEKTFRPIHVFNETTIPTDAIAFMQKYDSPELMDRGKEELQRHMEEFGMRHQMTRAVALSKALTTGLIYLNADGDILESSSGAVTTIDLQVPAAQKTTIGGIISANWDVAGTNIFLQLDALKRNAEVLNADPPKHVWVNSLAKNWLRNNTEAKAYFQNNQTQADKVLSGEVVSDFNGYDWHFYDGTYTATDGTTKYLLPQTLAVITPDVPPPGTGWWRAYETSESIAAQVGISQSLDQAMTEDIEMFGRYAYVYRDHNPSRYSLFMGDNFFYGFANPNSIYMATVA